VRKFPMWTGSWLAYGEILRNSAVGAVRFLNKATMRPHVVRIASTGKGVTIEIMGKGATTGNTGQGVTTMTTNEGIDCTCVAGASDSFRIRGRAQWPVLYFSPEGTLLRGYSATKAAADPCCEGRYGPQTLSECYEVSSNDYYFFFLAVFLAVFFAFFAFLAMLPSIFPKVVPMQADHRHACIQSTP
jgi:hypothetical protein